MGSAQEFQSRRSCATAQILLYSRGTSQPAQNRTAASLAECRIVEKKNSIISTRKTNLKKIPLAEAVYSFSHSLTFIITASLIVHHLFTEKIYRLLARRRVLYKLLNVAGR